MLTIFSIRLAHSPEGETSATSSAPRTGYCMLATTSTCSSCLSLIPSGTEKSTVTESPLRMTSSDLIKVLRFKLGDYSLILAEEILRFPIFPVSVCKMIDGSHLFMWRAIHPAQKGSKALYNLSSCALPSQSPLTGCGCRAPKLSALRRCATLWPGWPWPRRPWGRSRTSSWSGGWRRWSATRGCRPAAQRRKSGQQGAERRATSSRGWMREKSWLTYSCFCIKMPNKLWGHLLETMRRG